MKPYRMLLFFLCLACAVLSDGLWNAVADAGSATVPTRADNDATTRKAYDYFYNLEYDKAIHELELALAAHPDDPFAVNHLLAAVVFKELYRIGALDTEAYAADNFLTKKLAAPLDPAVASRVKQLTDQSLALSQAQLDNERVLELHPQYIDAKVSVGTDLYVVGSLSWPVKVAASVAGLSGNKQKGLDYLRQAASSNHVEVAVDAKIILALFLRREQKYAEALQVVNGLQSEYPRNFLMAAEYAHLLNAAGHGQEAIAAYRKVLAGCHNNVYVGCKTEIAAYGLGEALRGQKEYVEAAQAYELAANSGKDSDLKQKATLAAGEMYDVLQKRDTALEKYKAVIAENSATNSADLARHYIKQAYKTP